MVRIELVLRLVGRAILLLNIVILTACAVHKSHPPLEGQAPGAMPPDYLDLQPGWRVEVITPVTRSGGFNVHLKAIQSSSGGVNLATDPDFVGYESSYYDVRRKNGSEISIDFRSAQLHRDGKVTREPHPIVSLFNLPPETRYVRLMYLLRLSQADHDMAVVSGSSLQDCEARTDAVRKDPIHGCLSPRCSWVPAGIAVHRYAHEK